jgi:hypothetical protein
LPLLRIRLAGVGTGLLFLSVGGPAAPYHYPMGASDVPSRAHHAWPRPLRRNSLPGNSLTR